MIEGKARCATCHVPPLYNKHLKLNLTEQDKEFPD